MKGCISMCPNEGHTHKSTNHKDALQETQPAEKKNKTKDPQGVFMPPEEEMSPAQLG